jgi:hypothetical protein
MRLLTPVHLLGCLLGSGERLGNLEAREQWPRDWAITVVRETCLLSGDLIICPRWVSRGARDPAFVSENSESRLPRVRCSSPGCFPMDYPRYEVPGSQRLA